MVKSTCCFKMICELKLHYDLSCFRPLLRGNNPMFSDLILKMNRCYNEVSIEFEKFTW
jgi:hypothetical protein